MKKYIFIIILVAILIIAFLFYKKSNSKPAETNIASYRNSSLGISFQYPKKLKVTGTTSSIKIHHEVPFEHHDYCDFKGEATTTIKTLTDFNVEMHLVNQSIIKAMKTESPYIPEENFLNGKIVVSPGFIDPVTFGNLKGYSIFEGAEGCGHTIYYFEIESEKTLVVTNDFITIFSGAIDTENMDRALAVPDVINKQSATSIFESIVNSLKVE